MQRSNDGIEGKRGGAARFQRSKWRARRLRSIGRFAGRRAASGAASLSIQSRSRPVRSSILLGLVGLLLLAPLLLDDLVFRASYLLRLSEDAIAIDRPAVISSQPPVRLASGLLSLPPSPTGKVRTGEAVVALVRGGDARMALRAPVFEVDLSGGAAGPSDLLADGPSVEVSPGTPSPLIEALLGATFETLAIRDGTIVFDLGQGWRESLTAVDGEVAIRRRYSATFKGTAQLRGEVVRFDITVGARASRGNRQSRLPVRGRIESAVFQATIDGQLELDQQSVSIAGTQIDMTVPNVRGLARALGHMWPSGPGLKDFAARGTLDWSGSTLALNRGRYWLDGNVATGTLSLTLHKERPQIVGTLAFATFDATPYASRSPQASETPDAAQNTLRSQDLQAAVQPRPQSLVGHLKRVPDIRWPMIGMVDADLRLSAEQVRLAAFEAGQSAASLSVKAGQLTFNVAEILLDDGSRAVAELGVSGTASYPNYTLRGRLEEADLATLSQSLTGVTAIRGKGQAVFDLASSGASGADAIGRLSGKLDVGLPDGGTIACSHRTLLAAAKSGRTGQDVCGSSLSVAPTTIALRFNAGRLVAERAEAIAGNETVSVTGSLDLDSSLVDVAVMSGPLPPKRLDDVGLEPSRLNIPDAVPAQGEPTRSDAGSSAKTIVVLRGRPGALVATIVP